MMITIKRKPMAEDKKNSKVKKILIYTALFLTQIGIAVAGAWLYGISDYQVLRLACLFVVADIFIVFSLKCSSFYRTLFITNYDNNHRFYISFIISLIFAFIFPAMPVASWPIIVIFLVLTMLSNIPTGIMAALVCLVVSASMIEADCIPYFITYFIAGLITALLISFIDEEFRIGFPIFISEIVLISGLIIVSVTGDEPISVDLFIYPVINAAISLLIILLILKIYSTKIIFSETDKYIDINDPECQILTELKSCSPDDYYKSVHVAYFCDRIAKKLNLDDNAVKCAGFYHRIGAIGGKRNWENTKLICEEQHIPNEVYCILEQFMDPACPVSSAECAVLYMSECIVSSIKYLFNKNKDITLDYPALIDAIFKQRVETGIFNECNISIRQFEEMKKVFVEEKLYYDFLR